MPEHEYRELRAALPVDPDGEDMEARFREDYEIWGAEDGEIRISYEGECQECHLRVTFQHAIPFFPETAS